MESAVVHEGYVDLLVWVVAGEGVVQDLDVKPAAGAHVLVASAAPVLPLPDLPLSTRRG